MAAACATTLPVALPVHAADVPVTLATLAGADGDVAGLDGVDLMPTIAGGATGARTEVPINVLPSCIACKQQTKAKGTVPYSALMQRSADGQHTLALSHCEHVAGFGLRLLRLR